MTYDIQGWVETTRRQVAERDKLAAELRDKWAAKHNLTPAGGRECVCRLGGHRHDRHGRCPWGDPPGCDHPSLWNRDGRPAVFVFQPYGLSHDQVIELASFARDHELRLHIDTWPAWHNPGSVLQVELWAPDMDIWDQALKDARRAISRVGML